MRGDHANVRMGRQCLPSGPAEDMVGLVSPERWDYYVQVVEAPPGARGGPVLLLNDGAEGNAYFDDVVFVELGAPRADACRPANEAGRRLCGAPLVPAPRLLPPERSWSPKPWQPSAWLPAFVDRRLQGLAKARERLFSTDPYAATNADAVSFGSASDLVAYLPRAVQIGLFAPFPSQWSGRGAVESSGAQRRIAALEMMGAYLALLGLPAAVWWWRKRAELSVLLWLCGSMIVVYGVAVVNVGTLYRMRYGYLMLLMALGIAGGLTAWQRLRARRCAAQGAWGARAEPSSG